MAVNNAAYLKGVYGAAKAMGQSLLSSDFTMEPIGYEGISLLMKGFSIPFLSPGEPVEVPLPLGIVMGQPSQVRIFNTTGIQLRETVSCSLSDFMETVIAQNGAQFDANVYSGTPDQYYQVWTLRDCILTLEPAEADAEARTSLLNVGGNLAYHYFGERKAGPLLVKS